MDDSTLIDRLRESIPHTPVDDLLRSWGYDLIGEYAQIVRAAGMENAAPVLELATGSGRMIAVLTRLGFRIVTGDITDEEHTKALRRVTPAHIDHIRRVLLDMRQLPFRDHSVPSIVCLNTIHELDDPRRCISELMRVHDRQGILIIGDFNETGFAAMQRVHHAIYGDAHREGFLKMEEVRQLLSPNYPVIHEVVTALNISYIATGRQAHTSSIARM
jgi:ubiquinone/menaquinone biosynthesis C-methylase UbiE